MGKDGDADVLLVHSPATEKEFMEAKARRAARRRDVQRFRHRRARSLTRPKSTGMNSAGGGLQGHRGSAKAPFISRGDDSGTHVKEKSIWTAAKIEPKGDWYLSAGQGMGAVLTMADEKQGYTLSDRATYLALTQKGLKVENPGRGRGTAA